MSLFDKDLVTKEIPVFREDYTVLGNRLTFMGKLPNGTDISNFIEVDKSFIVDPLNGNMYIKDN